MTAPGPMDGWTIQDICPCRCHRTGNPEDYDCPCRDCGEGLGEQ